MTIYIWVFIHMIYGMKLRNSLFVLLSIAQII